MRSSTTSPQSPCVFVEPLSACVRSFASSASRWFISSNEVTCWASALRSLLSCTYTWSTFDWNSCRRVFSGSRSCPRLVWFCSVNRRDFSSRMSFASARNWSAIRSRPSSSSVSFLRGVLGSQSRVQRRDLAAQLCRLLGHGRAPVRGQKDRPTSPPMARRGQRNDSKSTMTFIQPDRFPSHFTASPEVGVSWRPSATSYPARSPAFTPPHPLSRLGEFGTRHPHTGCRPAGTGAPRTPRTC